MTLARFFGSGKIDASPAAVCGGKSNARGGARHPGIDVALPPAVILKTAPYPFHHGCVGIVRSLGEMGVPVYVVSESRVSPITSSKYVTGVFVWDLERITPQAVLRGLAAIGERLEQAILIPTDDFGAALVAEHADILHGWFRFPKLACDLPRSLADKQSLYQLCTKLHIPTPRVFWPQSAAETIEVLKEVEFPVVVKAAAAWLESAPKTVILGSREELARVVNGTTAGKEHNLLVQEYIPGTEDWFFHGYCNDASECLLSFTGRKIRSFPARSGFTALGRAESNDMLRREVESLLKELRYAGIMDIDYRLDPRDGRYKLLDFNPRIGAQFRLFENSEGVDVARALYFDMVGQRIKKLPQRDGRRFIVEPYDCAAAFQLWRQGKLSLAQWLASLGGQKEFAWFKRNDLLPFLMIWFAIMRRLTTTRRLWAFVSRHFGAASENPFSNP